MFGSLANVFYDRDVRSGERCRTASRHDGLSLRHRGVTMRPNGDGEYPPGRLPSGTATAGLAALRLWREGVRSWGVRRRPLSNQVVPLSRRPQR